MGIEVISCPQCGTYYNATDYKECPYCSNGMVKPTKKQKKKPWWGRAVQQSATVPIETEAQQQKNSAPPVPQETPSISDSPRRSLSEPEHTVPPTLPLAALLEQQNSDEVQQEQQNHPERVNSISASLPNSGHDMEVNPAPRKKLEERIDSIGKTTAKYISYSNGEVTYPVVGWLVGVKGVYYGKSFPLKSGVNRIGRSSEFEVAMLLDNSVSHEVVVKILYDPKKNTFMALPGESALCYINGNCVYEKTDLSGYEKIELGDSEKNCFVFVPFCGSNFNWSDYAPKE